MQNRAYSLLHVKGIDDERRIFRGIATTPTPDRIGDSIDPLGVKFAADLPLLWQHKHDAPIGRVRFEKPTKSGIAFEATIPVIHEAGPLKDRVDTAWGEIKHGLVRATSIGFLPTAQPTVNKAGGWDFPEVEVYELSAVTIPMQAEALITQVKSIDAALRAAEGIVDEDDTTGNEPLIVTQARATVEAVTRALLHIPEIPSAPETPAKSGNAAPVVRLSKAASDEAPFVIRRIHPAK